jgi:hypothetical protein
VGGQVFHGQGGNIGAGVADDLLPGNAAVNDGVVVAVDIVIDDGGVVVNGLGLLRRGHILVHVR